MTHPEHRYKNFYENIKDALEENEPNRAYIEQLATEMYNSIITDDHPLLGKSLGAYNRKFTHDWKNIFLKLFGPNFAKLSKMQIDDFNAAVSSTHKKILENLSKLSQGNEKLNAFSE